MQTVRYVIFNTQKEPLGTSLHVFAKGHILLNIRIKINGTAAIIFIPFDNFSRSLTNRFLTPLVVFKAPIPLCTVREIGLHINFIFLNCLKDNFERASERIAVKIMTEKIKRVCNPRSKFLFKDSELYKKKRSSTENTLWGSRRRTFRCG